MRLFSDLTMRPCRCDLAGAVSALERLVREAPAMHLCDALVFNLCTLYDLSCDNRASARKKRVLQGVAERYLLDDIDPASFRIG